MLQTKRERILFALPSEGEPIASLKYALSIARQRDAMLEVLRVVAGAPQGFWRVRRAGGRPAVISELKSLVRTRRWVAEVAGPARCIDRVRVCAGEFGVVAARRAAQIEACLVVIPELSGRFGKSVAELAHQAALPVLVARQATPAESVLAATDLEDAHYPVLTAAADLSSRHRARLIALHNLAPTLPVTPFAPLGGSVGWPVLHKDEDALSRALQTRLETAAHTLAATSEAIVARELTPVDAILREARQRRTDLIVVGTRPRTWLSHLSSSGVAAEVVNRTGRSVLVTPLSAERGSVRS